MSFREDRRRDERTVETEVIFRASKVVDGRILYARDFGKRAWAITVPKGTHAELALTSRRD